MTNLNHALMTNRTAALVFAFMASVSAISAAVAPAFVHI
jgi:hypothetical protein